MHGQKELDAKETKGNVRQGGPVHERVTRKAVEARERNLSLRKRTDL